MIFSYPAVVHASFFAVVRSTFVAFALFRLHSLCFRNKLVCPRYCCCVQYTFCFALLCALRIASVPLGSALLQGPAGF